MTRKSIELSDCCGAAVTFSDAFGTGAVLCCKKCWREVSPFLSEPVQIKLKRGGDQR